MCDGMEKYLIGWKNEKEVWIPQLDNLGFREKVQIRLEVVPKQNQSGVVEARVENAIDRKDDPYATVYIRNENALGDPNKTVFLCHNMKFGYVERLQTGEKIALKKETILIGNSESADFRITGNPTVSRKHALLYWRDGDVYLEDLDSLNHSWIGNDMISEPRKLVDHTIFRLSDEEFEYTTGRANHDMGSIE